MQILLNSTEVSEVVLGYVKDQLGLDETNNFTVECHDDGTIAVYVNEDSGNEPKAQAETQPAPRRRQRRSNKAAEATEPGNASSDTPSTTTSVADVKPTEAAPVEVAGVTTPEASVSPGTEAAAETEVEPSNAVVTTVAVEVAEAVAVVETAAAQEPTKVEVVAEQEAQAEEEPPRKPTQSLFANLRKPNNG
ncbi:hypothetical protein D3C84_48570 [compost metagenome]